MQRKLRAREKRQIGTQVKFDSTKTINHQQTHVCSFEYTIIRKWLKQPLFLCYNKKYFILLQFLYSMTSGTFAGGNDLLYLYLAFATGISSNRVRLERGNMK